MQAEIKRIGATQVKILGEQCPVEENALQNVLRQETVWYADEKAWEKWLVSVKSNEQRKMPEGKKERF